MNALGLRYAIYAPLVGLNAPAEITGAELLGPQGDGTVRMKVNTVDPAGKPRVYTVTIEED
jgi:hypothetical protein